MGRPLYINKLGKKPPMCSEDHRDSEKYEWFKCIFRRISKWIWHEESCRLWKCLTQWDLPIFRFSSYWWFKIKSDTGLWVWFRIRLESQGTFGPWRRFSLYRVPFYFTCLGECCSVKLQKCYMDAVLHPTFHQHGSEQMNDWNFISGELLL